ncbi:MMPL family transporter [Ornithinimicrobium cryptoxanthini]|uniref:MMPL family transporter n=1 Tax=Ornithinimicrobium cryptoxanthini TaxID=2934161 RepID=A0ABY4YNQ7_9MICO|nr:MMPL family transporter [Ornithinimicrobium cryptoxanthini]USQ77772.1 MMPL family transporter [Ornithinimicrobium cryptoxanthini]
MASFLHRLGRWCANHPWRTIVAWVLVVAAASTAAATLAKPLSNEFSIPGSRFEAVLTQLKAEIPEAAGAMGTVVFSSDDGFDDADRAAVGDLIEEWGQRDGVTAAIDPFSLQAQLDASDGQLTDAREELRQGRAGIETGWSELRAAQQEIDNGWTQYDGGLAALDENRAALPPEAVAEAEAQLEQAREQLEAGQAELDAGKQELEAGAAELTAGEEQVALGERLAGLSEGMRFVSEDGTVALAQVQFELEGAAVDPEIGTFLQETGEALEADTGITVDYSQSIVQDIASVVGTTEAVGIAVAAIVLLVMLGSVLAAGLPLLMALVGVGVGVGGAMALTQVVDMNSATPALALMLGLAVGIDYSLFLINRHRTQLRQGMAMTDSIALATGTSGNAVVFAGMTVFIALAALVVTGIPFLGVMGLVAAGTVLVAVLLAITLTPALLSLLGTRVLGRRRGTARRQVPEYAEDPVRGRGGWAAWVQRRPWAVIVGVLVIVGTMAFPALDIRLGLPDGSSEPADSTAYATFDLTREHFGAGANGPIVAVATMDAPIEDSESALMEAQVGLAEDLAHVPGAESVVPFGVSEDRTTLAFQIVPEGGPAEEVTVDLVGNLDNSADQIGEAHAAELGFTGATVANIDISQQLADVLPLYLVVVVGLSLVLLLLVFRSILVPLLATGGFLLSIAASFGAVVAVYQWGVADWLFGVHEPGPILSFLPILLIGVLFGLAMDYQVFLVTAMREAHVHGEEARRAIVSGFNHSAQVVTAAAIIMISVFGGFVFAHLAMVRPIGLGLAMGVLVDAFLVRMTLTPAVLSLLGEKAWWLPRWLDRTLPDMDVEGSQLERSLGVDTYPDGDVDVVPDAAGAGHDHQLEPSRD